MLDFDSDPNYRYECRRVNDPIKFAEHLGISFGVPGSYKPPKHAIGRAREDLQKIFAEADDSDSSAIVKIILRETGLVAARADWLSTIIERLEKRGHLPLISSWAIFRAFEVAEVNAVHICARCTLHQPSDSESIEHRNLIKLGLLTPARRKRLGVLQTTRNFGYVQPKFTTGVVLVGADRARRGGPDGPYGIDQWCHNGIIVEGRLTPKPWKLAKYLFERLGTKVPLRALNRSGALWDGNIKDTTIPRHGSDISTWFATRTPPIPLIVESREDHIWMERLRTEE